MKATPVGGSTELNVIKEGDLSHKMLTKCETLEMSGCLCSFSVFFVHHETAVKDVFISNLNNDTSV